MNKFEVIPAGTPEHEKDYRQRLAVCLTAARAYNGTEDQYQRLLEEIEEFERWQFDTFRQQFSDNKPTRLSEQSERTLLARYHPAVAAEARTVSGLLTFAVQRCSDRMRRGDEVLFRARAQRLDGTLLPTGSGAKKDSQGEQPFTKEAIFSPRLRFLLAALQERGVYPDDVVMWVGEVPEHALKREKPYVLVEIPRLQDRQVLVCDQVDEATFVVTQPLDKDLLLKRSKEQLLRDYPDVVKRIVWSSEDAWKERVMETLWLGVVPGKKIDIALREEVRTEWIKQYPIAAFFEKDGALKTDWMIQKFTVQGKKLKKLAHLFGMQEKGQDVRTELACLRLLAQVYGYEKESMLEKALRAEEQTSAIQAALGKEGARWGAFIQGQPIEIQCLGKVTQVAAEHPVRSVDEFIKLSPKEYYRLHIAGIGITALAGMLISEELIGREETFPRTELGRLLLARALFGEQGELNDRVAELRREEILLGHLKKDEDAWRAYMKGEEIEVKEGDQIEKYKADKPLPSLEEFWKLDRRTIPAYSFAGKGVVWIARTVFAPSCPEVVTKDLQETKLGVYLLAKALYGGEEAAKKYREEQENLAVQTTLGDDTDKWRAFIKGESVVIEMEGQKKEIRLERPFRTMDELLAINVKDLLKIDFAGVRIHTIASIFLKNGSRNVIVTNQDVKKVAIAIFGEEVGSKKESVSKAYENGRRYAAVIKVLNRSRKQWREFIQGQSVEVELDGHLQHVKVEQSFKTKEEFLALSRKERHDLRIAGLGLSALATEIGYRPRGEPVSYKAYYGEAFEGIASAIFDEEV